MVKQTAGHDALGEFAPEFAQLNDDVLFGEVWSREEKLSPRDRSMITVSALMASGILDSSLKYHISHAKENGIYLCSVNMFGQFEKLKLFGGSIIADPLGNVIAECSEGEQVAICDICLQPDNRALKE